MGTCWECCWHNGSGTHPPFSVISRLPEKFLGNFYTYKKFLKILSTQKKILRDFQTQEIFFEKKSDHEYWTKKCKNLKLL
jgi:hypothetical protein